MKQYSVESKWTGWFGGWGSEADIADQLNRRGGEGWTLIRTESYRCGWWWFLPRIKTLFIFERDGVVASTDTAREGVAVS